MLLRMTRPIEMSEVLLAGADSVVFAAIVQIPSAFDECSY
jgi:hypothetical protein